MHHSKVRAARDAIQVFRQPRARDKYTVAYHSRAGAQLRELRFAKCAPACESEAGKGATIRGIRRSVVSECICIYELADFGRKSKEGKGWMGRGGLLELPIF